MDAPLTDPEPEIVMGWDEFRHEGMKMDIDTRSALENANLTDREDMVLEMHCVHNISQRHIARLMGLGPPSISRILSDARQKLKEALY